MQLNEQVELLALLEEEFKRQLKNNISTLSNLVRLSGKKAENRYSSSSEISTEMRADVSPKIYSLFLAYYHYEFEKIKAYKSHSLDSHNLDGTFNDAINMLLSFAIMNKLGIQPSLADPDQMITSLFGNTLPYLLYISQLKKFSNCRDNNIDKYIRILRDINTRKITSASIPDELMKVVCEYHDNYVAKLERDKRNNSQQH